MSFIPNSPNKTTQHMGNKITDSLRIA